MGPKRENLIGQKFSRLIVTAEGDRKGGRVAWVCDCECGGKAHVRSSDLKSGSVRSCGCLLAGPTAANVRHGHSARRERPTPTYNSWRGMIDRCTNEGHISYPFYGAKGVTVCDRWKDFTNFLADMGERPEGKTIDRINPEGNYEPSNCRWADWKTQRANRRIDGGEHATP